MIDYQRLRVLFDATDPAEWVNIALEFVTPETLVIRDDLGLAAFLRKLPDGSFIFSTRPNCRRRGLATRLLEAAQPIEWAHSTYTTPGKLTCEAFTKTMRAAYANRT